ncbi:MAG TPA: hypoxanthine-guanine phosphoribosyltransferase [Xanthomonadales bacterium]|nr:hypoxanthine-guanine phosphoribosyltransferase [Xanthomonadales bacterium]
MSDKKNPPKLADALEKADLLHDRATLMRAIERIGKEITRDFANSATPPLFTTVMNGGLIFAGHLALAIPIDMEFDYVHATRYRGDTRGGKVAWLKAPHVPMLNRHVLLIDDILDEGYTLAGVRDHCLAQGAASVRIAVLCEKRHDRRVPNMEAEYVGVEVTDRYVFGFGMDYYEQGRNLDGIYAI